MQKSFRSELFFGLVAPVGVNQDYVVRLIKGYLSKNFLYKPHVIRLSELIPNIPGVKTKINLSSEYSRIDTGMKAGNEARKINGLDIIAAHSIREVRKIRNKPVQGNAYIFRSMKNPEEDYLYRYVYGKGYFLLGFYSSRRNKIVRLVNKGMTKRQAEELIGRDAAEEEDYKQNTRGTFYRSDVFFDVDSRDFKKQLKGFLDLIFGAPYISPTKDEYAMFLAFSSSFRSTDLSRQVGAVVTSKNGEIISTGCNEVPKAGGGLYWPDDINDKRDFKLGYDANERRRNKIANKITNAIKRENIIVSKKTLNDAFHDAGLFDITEYGRAVHAEMEALLACSRVGISPRDGNIYSTTFPCHNCAKHIIASGIKRVVFVEPYPKSKALELHFDAIALNRNEAKKVVFQTFIGVGPRRFIDLFSYQLSSGVKIKRKRDGKVVLWKDRKSIFRFPITGMSYLDKEISIDMKLK